MNTVCCIYLFIYLFVYLDSTIQFKSTIQFDDAVESPSPLARQISCHVARIGRRSLATRCAAEGSAIKFTVVLLESIFKLSCAVEPKE